MPDLPTGATCSLRIGFIFWAQHMSNDKPYVKWYGRDWIGDTSLRMAGPELRGIWIDMLCMMMQGDPYGHLAISGRSMTDSEVASVIGISESAYKGYLYRLFELNIPSRTDCGMIYSRRLVREYGLFMSGKLHGKRGGGNPALSKSNKNNTIQNPETRSHIPEAKGGLKVPYKGTYIGMNEKTTSCSDKSERCVSASDPAFDRFWAVWPPHFRKTNRAGCLKKWKAMKLSGDIDAIIEGVEAWKKSESWAKDDGQFVPMPMTFINRRQWEDLDAAKATHFAPDQDPYPTETGWPSSLPEGFKGDNEL